MSSIGKIYQITFLDHCESSQNGEALTCCVYGKCIGDTEHSITLVCWDILDADQETIEENRTTYTIVKSTILTSYEMPSF
jgi:hypothetical protein